VSRSSILKSAQRNKEQLRREEASILRIRAVPCLSFVLMGSMDWLTTIIGIVYFGAVEGNPFLAEITRTSLPAFTAIKLSTTIIVGLLFYKAEKTLLRTQDKNSRSFRCTRVILRGTYIAATVFLLIAVLNNLIVVARAI
jgi:predicted secreted protein